MSVCEFKMWLYEGVYSSKILKKELKKKKDIYTPKYTHAGFCPSSLVYV